MVSLYADSQDEEMNIAIETSLKMIKQLLSWLCFFMILATSYPVIEAVTNLFDVTYTAPNGRLTVSTPTSFFTYNSVQFSCFSIDRYNAGWFIYCDGDKVVQWRTVTKEWRVHAGYDIGIAPLQIDIYYWFLIKVGSDCIIRVKFTGHGDYKAIAGCRGKGNQDGVGTDATFDGPKDLLFNVFDRNQLVVLTRTKLRSVEISTNLVSTYPVILPEGLTQMVWHKNSLILLSRFFLMKLQFTSSGTGFDAYFSEVGIIHWLPKNIFPANVFNSTYSHYPTDVAPTTKDGIFLAASNDGSLQVLDLINNQTKIVNHENTCLQANFYLDINEQTSEMRMVYGNKYCDSSISWVDITTTTTTTATTTPTTTTPSTTSPTTTTSITTTTITTTTATASTMTTGTTNSTPTMSHKVAAATTDSLILSTVSPKTGTTLPTAPSRQPIVTIVWIVMGSILVISLIASIMAYRCGSRTSTEVEPLALRSMNTFHRINKLQGNAPRHNDPFHSTRSFSPQKGVNTPIPRPLPLPYSNKKRSAM